jgi:hypothetical protein
MALFSRSVSHSAMLAPSRRLNEKIADWLNVTSMKLGLARLHLHAGRADEGHRALEALHEEIQFAREQIEGKRPRHFFQCREAGPKACAIDHPHRMGGKCLAAFAG